MRSAAHFTYVLKVWKCVRQCDVYIYILFIWLPTSLATKYINSYFMLIHNFVQNNFHLIIIVPTVAISRYSDSNLQFPITLRLCFYSDIHRSFDFVISRRSHRKCAEMLFNCNEISRRTVAKIKWTCLLLGYFLLFAEFVYYGQEWNESYNLPFAKCVLLSHINKKIWLFLFLLFRWKERST